LGGQRVLSEQAVKGICFEPSDRPKSPASPEFSRRSDGHSGFGLLPRLGGGNQYKRPKGCLEKGGALDGVRTLLLVVPRSASPVAIVATAKPHGLRKRCAPPCCSRFAFGPTGRTRHAGRDHGAQGQPSSKACLLAVE